MELTIPTVSKEIKLGYSFDAVKKQLSGINLELDIDDSSAPIRRSLTSKKLGFSLNFKDETLSAIFLYVDKKGFSPFSGKITYLDDAFWKISNAENFKLALTSNGFTEWPKKYPNAVDMVTDKIRIRLTTRPNSKMISIDDGSFIRNLARENSTTLKVTEAVIANDYQTTLSQKRKSKWNTIIPDWLRAGRIDSTIRLPSEGADVTFHLGELKETALQKLALLDTTVLYLEDKNSVSLKEYGVHMVFHLNRLAVFDLYISNSEFKPFRGSCIYLKSAFWQNPTSSTFKESLKKQKFSLSGAERTNCIDMVKKDINVRYNQNNQRNDRSIRVIQRNIDI